MPAKVGSRGKSAGDQDFVPFVIVKRSDKRRVYLGAGIDQATAERLAQEMQVPCFAAALTSFDDQGRWIADDDNAA